MMITRDRVASICFMAALCAFASSATASKLGQVKVFEVSDVGAQPAVARNLGGIQVYLCRKAWESPPTKQEALYAIGARAAGMNADGVISVRFDRARLSLLDRRCWQRLAVMGDAVTFASRVAP